MFEIKVREKFNPTEDIGQNSHFGMGIKAHQGDIYNMVKLSNRCSKVFFLAVVLTFLLNGFVNPVQSQVVDRIVAVVNDDIVLLSELNELMAPYKERLKQQGFPLEKERKMLFKIREEVVNRLVDEKLADQEIKKFGITVSDKEIDATLERIKSINFYTDEDLREFLKREGMDLDQYKSRVREKIQRSKLVNYTVKSKIVITDEDIRAYYEGHPKEYGGKSTYHLSNIMKTKPVLATDSELDEIKAEMQKIIRSLKDGVSFDKLAGMHSEAPNAAGGGDLGVFEMSALSPLIQNAIKGLKSGQFTPVLDTDQGFQIFYVKNINSLPGKPLDSVKPEIQEKLYTKVVDEKYKSWIEDLRSRSHIKIIK